MDLRGDGLTLAGTQSDIQATVDIHNANVGPYYNVTVNSSGLVSKTSVYAQYGGQVAGMLDAVAQTFMTPEQRAYAGALDKVVNGAGMATINIVNESQDILIGSIAKATIDIGDIQKIGNGDVSSATTLMHETAEQYGKQVRNMTNERAHFEGIGVENTISGKTSLGAQQFPEYFNGRNSVSSPSGVIIVPFKNGSSTIIKYSIKINGTFCSNVI